MNAFDLISAHEGLRMSEEQRSCSCGKALGDLGRRSRRSRCLDCKTATRAASRAKYRKWAREHKDELNAQNRARYHANKASRRATQQKYETRVREEMRTDRIRHAKALIKSIRQRSRRDGIVFDLDYRDIPIPDRCPVLGLSLIRAKGHMLPNSATVDRIDPRKGYVKGNVIIVSLRANVIKNDATPDEILRVGLFYKQLAEMPS